MKQKLHSLLLLVVLLSWSIAIAASDFDDGILKYTITSPENLEVKCDGFTDAHKNDESVVIPETVKYNKKNYTVVLIRNLAFWNCSGLTSINIPSSVTSIGDNAFQYCSSLTSINIPSSVTSIGDNAFGYCSSLTSINIPSSVTSIGDNAFQYCSSLTSINIPSSVTSIGDNAFGYCRRLTSINIPSSVTSIGDDAFRSCSSLTSINIPSSVISIGNYAFSGCSGLTSIDIPSSVTSIGHYAFSGCSGLTSINIPSSVTSIGDFAFSGCSGLTSIDIPSCVTTINGLFADCSGLTSIDIPSRVTSIDSYAFRGCSGLTSIDIPSSVTSIGFYAFSGCSGLTSIDIPSSVTSIGHYAFSGCSGLTSINIPSSVTSIGDNAFEKCSSLTSLVIPSSIYSIPDYAFYDCTKLISIKFPLEIKSIGNSAFQGCTSLESVKLPNSIESLGSEAFAGCLSLTSITLPSNIEIVPPYFVANCSVLKSIEIPVSVKTVWFGAFYQCKTLKSIICNSLEAPAFRQYPLSSSVVCSDYLCEPALASQITLVTPKGAVGYTEAPWSYFKAPEALRLTDENASLDAGAYPIGSLTYYRSNMTSGSYATFCLPFDTNLSEVSDAFENVYTANQTALYKPDGKLILLLQKIDKDASISAGQPFVAKLKDNVTDVTFSNNKLMTVDSDIMQNGTPTPLRVFDWDGTSGLLTENTDIKVSYGGALTTMTGVGSEYETFNSNGTFGPTKGGQVKAFRAYVLKEDAVTQGRVKSISLGIEGNDGTTNIETIVDSPEKNTDKMVYSIDGRLVNTTGSVVGLPSGIYIKNHQKIYVK